MRKGEDLGRATESSRWRVSRIGQGEGEVGEAGAGEKGRGGRAKVGGKTKSADLESGKEEVRGGEREIEEERSRGNR